MARFGSLGTQYFDENGNPLAGGKIYFYQSGTTSPSDTWADEDQTIANTNPVILTADGRQPNIFFGGQRRAVLTDRDDVQIEVRDPVGFAETPGGGGVVGINAARMAMGLGADVTLLDSSLDRLKELDMIFGGRLKTVYSTEDAIERHALEADLVVGAVLIPGAAAPKLITRELVSRMKKGAVMVDVAIDQGGCFETSRATTHQDPTYVVDGVVHYCVANMPGGVARSSTMALTNATLPYALALADKGVDVALADDEHLRNGLNVHAGMGTYEAVADALGYDYVSAMDALARSALQQTA